MTPYKNITRYPKKQKINLLNAIEKINTDTNYNPQEFLTLFMGSEADKRWALNRMLTHMPRESVGKLLTRGFLKENMDREVFIEFFGDIDEVDRGFVSDVLPSFDDVKDFFTIKDDAYYYERFYPFQDKILELVFSKPTNFYVTGGSTLNRFILPSQEGNTILRHAEDLDFFINLDGSQESLDYFVRAKKAVIEEIEKVYKIEEESDFLILSAVPKEQKDVSTYYVYNDDVKLKLQFILDLRQRSNSTLLVDSGYRLDNLHNIITSKLATLLYREEFKDMVDVYHIALLDESIVWGNLITQCNQSAKFYTQRDVRYFKEYCKRVLEIYREIGVNTLAKRVSLGRDKAYQRAKVAEVLDNFERVVLAKL